jgi:hypothetical protein
MLVDLARNDVNRVCDPLSTRVDKLMVVQKVRAFRPNRDYRGSCDELPCDDIKSNAMISNPRSMLIALETSFRTCSTWSRRCQGCCDLARRDSTRSAPFSQLVSSALRNLEV